MVERLMLYPSCWMADYPAKKVFHLQLEFLLGPAISKVTLNVPAKFDPKRRRPTTHGKSATLRGNPPSVYKVGERVLIHFQEEPAVFRRNDLLSEERL